MNTLKAVFYTDTEILLSKLEEQSIDTSKCVICGGKIESTERKPRYLSEGWQSWRYGKKFYDWNIDAFLSDGVVCDRKGCFINALYRDKKSIDSDKLRKEQL